METYSSAKEQHRRDVVLGPKTWSLAVDYTDRWINDVIKIEIRYQNSSDTNMQSGMSMGSPVAVQIVVRAWSSTKKTEFRHKPEHFQPCYKHVVSSNRKKNK